MRCLVLCNDPLSDWLQDWLEKIFSGFNQIKKNKTLIVGDPFDVIFIVDLDNKTEKIIVDGLRQHSPGAPILRIVYSKSGSIGEDHNIYFDNGVLTFRDFNHQVMLAFRTHSLNALTNSVAHEINNRLTPILGKAKIMSNSPRTPGDMQADLGIIHGESLKIHDFINEIDRMIDDPKFRYEHQRVLLV